MIPDWNRNDPLEVRRKAWLAYVKTMTLRVDRTKFLKEVTVTKKKWVPL